MATALGALRYAGPLWRSKRCWPSDSGAIAAAATTSLPERIGGTKNWDYRYAWVRDSSFTLDALINLGLHEEVHGAVSWLLGAIRDNGGDLHVFYTLDGNLADEQEILDIPGWRDSQPVRRGTPLRARLQLGTYGDLFDTIFRYCAEGHLLDPATGRMLGRPGRPLLRSLAAPGLGHLGTRRTAGTTPSPRSVAGSPSTELSGSPRRVRSRPRTSSAGVRGPTRSAPGSTPTAGPTAKEAYTFYAGTDDLDAAVLLAGRTGFVRGPRLASTIDAIASELGHGPLLYRYTGMDEEEGAFVACSFWMVDALVRTGQTERARQLMDGTIALANDVGLLSEQIDPDDRCFPGQHAPRLYLTSP